MIRPKYNDGNSFTALMMDTYPVGHETRHWTNEDCYNKANQTPLKIRGLHKYRCVYFIIFSQIGQLGSLFAMIKAQKDKRLDG